MSNEFASHSDFFAPSRLYKNKTREDEVMKKLFFCGLALLALTAGARAADMPVKAPRMAVQAPMYNWTGWYLGAHVGGAWRDTDFTGATGGGNDGRFMAGVQGGFDYQFANSPIVVGLEANYSWVDSSNDAFTFPGGFAFTDRTRGLFSATGRVGYGWGPSLWYFKGGYAHRDSRETFVGPAGAVAFSPSNGSRNGYTLGGGIEYMFMPNWSVKAEYQFYEFDRTNFATPVLLAGTGGFRDRENTVKVGLNWRFNTLGWQR
jgi:outer membrane immunogenic protein